MADYCTGSPSAAAPTPILSCIRVQYTASPSSLWWGWWWWRS